MFVNNLVKLVTANAVASPTPLALLAQWTTVVQAQLRASLLWTYQGTQADINLVMDVATVLPR